MAVARALRRPPWTVRARLTLLYGGVFLISGLILLTVGYFLVRSNLNAREDLQTQLFHPRHAPTLGPRPLFPGGDRALYRAEFEYLRNNWIHRTLSNLLFFYVLALVVMTLFSVLVGWYLAGRALGPLRRIADAALRVSGENLGERIALQGPDDELKQLADTFDGMLGRLDAAFASQRHFVANASHELRTPLAIMRTELDVALADPEASRQDLREMGEALRESIDRSEGLIAALLALARSEAVTGAEESVELDVLAGDCVTDLHRRADEAGVTVDTEGLAPAAVRGDPALLERLLANLVDNGIRHNQPGGRLILSTTRRGSEVTLTVLNGGAVIPPEHVESLTQPFRRLSRRTAGYGLGLSIVSSVVSAHQGRLEVSAPSEGGLKIEVTLSADETAKPSRGRALPAWH